MERGLSSYTKGKLVLSLVAVVFSLVVADLGLRIFMPKLGSDLFKPDIPRETPFIYNKRIGYELKPFAFVDSHDEKGALCLEQVNSEGFRGPDYTIPKPKGVFRILALGDSIVEGFTVSYKQTWEQVLERLMNQRVALSHLSTRYEVINAGLGGYVSRQVLLRLMDRGLKYQPDLVLVLVGINDLCLSSLPNWTPLTDLTLIGQAWLKKSAEKLKKSALWASIRMPLYRFSYIARLVRQTRNNIYNTWRIHNLIRKGQKDSRIVFNEKALELYLENLEKIYNLIKANGAQMGLITWPILLKPELLNDSDIHWKSRFFYSNFPLSIREFWDWNKRYADAQREFTAAHPDVILIDAQAIFANKHKKEHIRLFTDMVHLTVEGNCLLGEVILDNLRHRIVSQK